MLSPLRARSQHPFWQYWRATFGGTTHEQLLVGFVFVLLLAVFAAAGLQQWAFLGIPVGLLLVFQTVVDYRQIYFLLIACLPLSTEYALSSSLATDLPSEPLMWWLTVVYAVGLLQNARRHSVQMLVHPLIALLTIHLLWIAFTVFASSEWFLSFKYFLAKGWYYTVFVFLTLDVVRRESDMRRFFFALLPSLTFSVVWVLVREAMHNFDFNTVIHDVEPFYRNHVNYASHLALLLPFVWFGQRWMKGRVGRAVWWAVLGIVLSGILLSYTRAAYLAVFIAIGAYWVFRLGLLRPLLGAAVVVGFLGVLYLANNNKYLDYAPKFEKAVAQKRFDDLVNATYKGHDISTMERVNRWVAGGRMWSEKPVFGFGPNCFYDYYKKYTVASFRTYVSRNEERSTIHCYFLLTLVEQGVPGAILFLIITFASLIYGERIYHRTAPAERGLVMMPLLSLVVIYSFLLVNDMIETDKVGAFFFMNIAMLANLDFAARKAQREAATATA